MRSAELFTQLGIRRGQCSSHTLSALPFPTHTGSGLAPGGSHTCVLTPLMQIPGQENPDWAEGDSSQLFPVWGIGELALHVRSNNREGWKSWCYPPIIPKRARLSLGWAAGLLLPSALIHASICLALGCLNHLPETQNWSCHSSAF